MDKIRVPFPDPLGILNSLTKDAPIELFDPLILAKEIQDASTVESYATDVAQTQDKKKSYVDDKITVYKFHLEKALENAPCPGCRAITKSALVGVDIFEEMQRSGKGKDDFTDEEINLIKGRVEEKYRDYA